MSEPWMARKIRFHEKLARAWSDAGIDWAVCNGLADYPADIGRDLDVVTAPEHLRRALEVTVRVMAEEGYAPLPFKLGWIYWVVGLIERDGVVECVQIDLFDHLQWAFSWPVDGVGRFGAPHERGPFLVDPAASVGKRVLINTLSNNGASFEKKPHYLDLSDGEQAVLGDVLKSLSGRREVDLAAAVLDRDVAALRTAAGGFRKRVMRHSLLRGRAWGRRMHSAMQKQWSMNLFPQRSVPTIAVQSDDGGIEKAVCQQLARSISDQLVFCKVIEVHNRPRFVFKKRTRWAWQLLADLCLGERLRDRRRSALQCVQIYRGHALAVHLDPARERLRRFPAWMVRAAPRPQLNCFVTSGDGASPADSWAESGELDRVIQSSADTPAEIFSAFVGKLEEIGVRQCRRLGLEAFTNGD